MNLNENNIRERLSRIYKTPLLATPERDRLLMQLINSKSDEKRNEIIVLLLKDNSRRVIEIAKEFVDSGPDFPKLVEAGTLGLADAISSYDPKAKHSITNFSNWLDAGIRFHIFADCLKMDQNCWDYFFAAHDEPTLTTKELESLCTQLKNETDESKLNNLEEHLVNALKRLVFDIASTFLFQAKNFFSVITAGHESLKIAVRAIALNKISGRPLSWIYTHIHYGIYEAFGLDNPEKALYDGELPSIATKLDNPMHYLKYVGQQTMLSVEEQQKLSEHLIDELSPKSIRTISNQLIATNLINVVQMTKEFISRGASMVELIQAGNRGLVKAVFEYDPSGSEINFSTYAIWQIRYAICSNCFGITDPEKMFDENALPPLLEEEDS